MENKSGLKAVIEEINKLPSKSIKEFIEEQIELSNRMERSMVIPIAFDKHIIPEIKINKDNLVKEMQEAINNDHYTDFQWASLYRATFYRTNKKR